MLIKACLNGGTTRQQHPSVPCTPGELAADAQDAVRAGAGAIHVHPRDASGAETLEPDAVLAAVRAIRSAVPEVPLGVTTGIWAVEGDPARRLELVSAWTGGTGPTSPRSTSPSRRRPLAAVLAGLGIAVEAGVWTAEDAELLAASTFGREVIRILIEPRDSSPEAAVTTAAQAEETLARHGLQAPRVHHGYGMATWHVIRAALEMGQDIRVGLEDTVVLPDGSTATGNGELVAAAARLATEAGRRF